MKILKRVLITVLTFLCATVALSQNVEKYGIFEVSRQGPASDNPFKDVQLSAEFTYKNRTYFVEGFYDGDGVYKIRFMPDEEGEWSYRTTSSAKELDGLTGTFRCTPSSPANHGVVKVRDTHHFGYADGTPFLPLGTTCYGWVWQGDELVNQTLETLSQTTFNKIRMTVMPKNYDVYINTDPHVFPFEGSREKGWDFSRFNPAYFRYLEDNIAKLGDLGIEADLILFHPYDYGRWNFDKASQEENVHYLRYVVARLGAHRNVWWSMANEYDLMKKPDEEWEQYFRTLQTYDPYGHLSSIHNGMAWYNHSKPWITHLSVQTPYLESIQDWRELYNKPVVIDEFVYEGNIPNDWGNLTPEETVNRFWIIWARGAYGTHGETYIHPQNILWWSKGGKLHGKSPERLAFLHKIMAEAPTEGLYPLHNLWNKETHLIKEGAYYLFYYGNSQQALARLRLPEQGKYRLEVIDAWNMTVTPVEGLFSGRTEIPLPGRPYVAVRAVAERPE